MIDQERWEIFWCYDFWDVLYDRLQVKLPEWCTLKRVNASQPLHEQVSNADVFIPTTGLVDERAVRSAPKLKLIVQPAAGHNNIAVETAASLGIPVCTAPGVNAASVAESALMTLLMLAKRVREQHTTFQQRGLGRPLGMQVAGKTLGIVGMGAIGSRLAQAAAALQMEVVGINSASSRSDFEAMLRCAHFVSLHCPLTPKTRGLLGRGEFEMMRPGAMVINYARGEVIDKEALLEALQSGKLGGAGLDVHWEEPADPQDPLYQHPSVQATPHTGVCTQDVIDAYVDLMVDNIVRRREGRELIHRLV
ncbi:D-3-phosphoglycerate dehydrogenase [Coccomyxa sp. Obi]|nr:D-3-phosphoglycerate dehydrogenase [Coccomyxa sp. Obi]